MMLFSPHLAVAFGGVFYIEPNFLSSEILIVPPKKIEKN
jgi:hypothetical protein